MKEVKLDYTSFKSITTAKSLFIQYHENIAEYYYLFALDGFIFYVCMLSKNGDSNQTDFENNLKSKCNQKVGVGDSQPYALPTYRTKRNATSNVTTCPVNTNTEIQYQITSEVYTQGGCLIVKNAEIGDYFYAEVEDIDGVIPSPYRAALCENWPVVSTYVIKEFIEVTGTYSVNRIDTKPLVAKLTTGLYLCLHYVAVNSGVDRQVAINYYFNKKL